MRLAKFIAAFIVGTLASVAQANNIEYIFPNSSALKWSDAASMPRGAKVTVLMGDPSKKGPFIARVKLPAGYTVPVHRHPVNEYDTIVSGTLYMGIGRDINLDQVSILPPGSFIKIPAHTAHYAYTKEETIIQISGTGPWGMIYR